MGRIAVPTIVNPLRNEAYYDRDISTTRGDDVIESRLY